MASYLLFLSANHTACYDTEMLKKLKAFIPKPVLRALLPFYHFVLAMLGACIYGFPSKKLIVVGVTGTKGKSSTTEILGSIFEASGHKTATLGTIKFKIGDKVERNLTKMTMPGRFFIQKFLREALDSGCTHAVIEMSSEGATQFRQRFIDMDALIFLNLSPEHIDAHGSYANYRDAKLAIARTLSRSSKEERFMVGNVDDKESPLFFAVPHVKAVPFSIGDAEGLEVDDTHASFLFHGTQIESQLGGKFNVMNMLAAGTAAMKLGIPLDAVAKGIARVTKIEGRLEHIETGQSFPVIVDYAHTPDSLEALYQTFTAYKTVCVLGNAGGGRDKWKRPVMGTIADKYCSHIVLTNEDPYDEDPETILKEIQEGISAHKPQIILDRREAIARALSIANEIIDKSPAVLITGKGTDPFIMGRDGTKLPWDDREVAEEELAKLI